VLAQDESRRHVAVDPKFISQHNDPRQVKEAMGRFLMLEPALVGARLARTDRQFAYLEKYVEEDRASELKAFLQQESLQKGVLFEQVQTRTYPHDRLFAHVLGFENREGVGSAGIEQEMDRYLKGKKGLRVGETDARRRELLDRRRVQIDPKRGSDVILTVDQYLQYGVEEALDRAMATYQAKGAWAVVMDVRTGAILAMASKPDYDLNAYNLSSPEERRNQTIGTTYEPGSIMKPLVFAAALNEGLVNPLEEIDCEWGRWIHRKRPLNDYHPYESLTAADVLKKSSNIGTAKIALRMSEETLHGYMEKFGFGQRTGIDLPGEETGILHAIRDWDSLTHSRLSIGHAVTVTALQMAVAINTLANDGVRVTPYVVQEVRDPNGELLFIRRPETERVQVIARQTARRMRHLLARITESGGTGRRARFGEYVVAGKTGTAEKVNAQGGYSKTQNRASFAGFFPAHNPALTIVVTVDEPQGDLRTGGTVAAPVFKEIGSYAARYLGIPPEGW
jgi:cell division protein FtsI (penicillin-binding protein 3)